MHSLSREKHYHLAICCKASRNYENFITGMSIIDISTLSKVGEDAKYVENSRQQTLTVNINYKISVKTDSLIQFPYYDFHYFVR